MLTVARSAEKKVGHWAVWSAGLWASQSVMTKVARMAEYWVAWLVEPMVG